MSDLVKKALCIGNNIYNDKTLGDLKYAINDALEISKKLTNLSFDSKSYTDLDSAAMATVIGDMIDSLDGVDVFIFYYAGHGCQINGKNYLIPKDACWQDGTHAFEHVCISLSDGIMEKLEKYTNMVKIVILDACRQNHTNIRGMSTSDFAPFSSPSESLIALSTSPGCISNESEKYNHGLYTNVLLRYIDMPHVNIETVFKRVRQDLVAETKGSQISWEHTSLIKDFKLNPRYASSDFNYSMEVFADNFRCNDPNIRAIVKNLKEGGFEIANKAIDELNRTNLNSAVSDDLFYLGRTIFYSATVGYYPSFSAQFYIKDFNQNTHLNEYVKIHIINGMAYQSYFGNQNKILCSHEYRENREIRLCIFDYLELKQYEQSREFIANKLQNVDNNPVFIPGDERIQFSITLDENDCVNGILFNGKTVMSYMGEKAIPSESDSFIKEISVDDLAERIAIALNARSNCVDLVFNKEIDKSKNLKCVPFDFDLRY